MLSLCHKNIDWMQNFRPFAEFYRSDLSCYKFLKAELDLWEAYWLNDTSCYQADVSSTLKSINFKSFSNVKVFLRILGTLPVTECTSERSFFFHEEIENIHSQYNDIRKSDGKGLMYVH